MINTSDSANVVSRELRKQKCVLAVYNEDKNAYELLDFKDQDTLSKFIMENGVSEKFRVFIAEAEVHLGLKL